MTGSRKPETRRSRPRGAAAGLVAAAVIAAAILLAGCESPSILRSEGSAGNEIVTLAMWIFGILAVVLITVWVILVFVIVTGRHRREEDASQTQGNLRIEIIWTAIPAVIVTVLFVLTVITTERITMPDPGTQFTAVGRQWWWDFDFKELGFKAPNEVYVAEGRTTSIDVESADVIHSFWVPQMGGKVDMIPGHVNHIHFVPLTDGTYLGECSEFCGVQHGKMRFLFVVVPPRGVLRVGQAPAEAGRRAHRSGRRRRQDGHQQRRLRQLPRHPGHDAQGHVRPGPHALRQPRRHRRLHADQHAREPAALDPGPAGGQARVQHAQRARCRCEQQKQLVAYLEELK